MPLKATAAGMAAIGAVRLLGAIPMLPSLPVGLLEHRTGVGHHQLFPPFGVGNSSSSETVTIGAQSIRPYGELIAVRVSKVKSPAREIRRSPSRSFHRRIDFSCA